MDKAKKGNGILCTYSEKQNKEANNQVFKLNRRDLFNLAPEIPEDLHLTGGNKDFFYFRLVGNNQTTSMPVSSIQ